MEDKVSSLIKQKSLYKKEIMRLESEKNSNLISKAEKDLHTPEIDDLGKKIELINNKFVITSENANDKDKILIDYSKFFRPFGFMYDLQVERRKHPKKSFLNLLQKMYGNGAYGKVAQGIGNNDKFSIKEDATTRMPGTEYSNPILASYITGFARCALGEMMHNMNFIPNAKIVSCTTDGFITNVENLEDKLLELAKTNKKVKITFLKLYRFLRNLLTDGSDPRALELKTSNSTMFSWSVRGQLSPHVENQKGIVAMTGIQRKHPLMKNLFYIADMLEESFNSVDKKLIYVQSSLRSAIDIYKKGGHVTGKFADRTFSVLFNNKRLIIDKNSKGELIKSQGTLLDSKPLNRLEDFLLLDQKKDLVRVEKHVNDKAYNREIEKMRSKYTKYVDLGVRRFISVLCDKGLDKKFFKNNQEIVDFIESYNESMTGFDFYSSKNEVVKKQLIVKPRLISDIRNRGKTSKLLPDNVKELNDFIDFIVKKSSEEGLDITKNDFK